MPKNKIFYIDNLKVLMTILVILHHTVITYGGPGSWYYMQKTTQMAALIPMTMFVSTNQSFFMGFFFFLSALFLEPSYNKKGPAHFFADRLKRFGIPLIFYSLVISPILIYLSEVVGRDKQLSFFSYMSGFHHWIDFGVLWFVAALLVFTLIYMLVRALLPAPTPTAFPPSRPPSDPALLFFAILLGVISFFVRLVFPVGWTLSPLGFQLGHFTQYIALFGAGIFASRYKWLDNNDPRKGRPWAIAAVLLVLLGFPGIYMVKVVTNCPIPWFSGGLHGQSLLYALWEQLTGMAIIIALTGWAKARWNRQSPLLKEMSRAAFGIYIIHPFFVISFALLLRNWAVDPVGKLPFVAVASVIASFAVAAGLARLPGLKKIL
ncbi:MAG TPA: acyltransferase [Puia sp.]|nr:acyltransferase [Puia sp.]